MANDSPWRAFISCMMSPPVVVASIMEATARLLPDEGKRLQSSVHGDGAYCRHPDFAIDFVRSWSQV